MNDQECLRKLKEARDLINALPATSFPLSQNNALERIDSVCDELEDRLAKAGGSVA